MLLAKCRCGRPLVFDRKEGNKLIYRCLDNNCHYSRDITEEEYKAMEQGQKEGESY